MSISLKPEFSESQALRVADKLWGIGGTAALLPGERDQNFLVTSGSGEKFVLKIVNRSEEKKFLVAEAGMIDLLNSGNCRVPEIIRAKDGELFPWIEDENGERYFTWMLNYIEGQPLGKISWHSDELLSEIGFELGRIDNRLRAYYDDNFEREFDWDLQFFPVVIDKYLRYVSDSDLASFVRNTLALYQRRVEPLTDKLRKSVVQNDANDYNLIIREGDEDNNPPRLGGLIDFGDTVYSWTIGNLAVLLAYIMLDRPDALNAAGSVVRGYNESFGLTPEEAEVLYSLIRMRISVSICMAAWQQSQRPGDEYLSISQDPIRRSVVLLESIDPDMAEAFFRIECGIPPNKNLESVITYISIAGSTAYPVLGVPLTADNCIVLDLSVNGEIIASNNKLNGEEYLSSRIGKEMEIHGVAIGIGRYDEPRILYNSPLFKNEGFSDMEDRTIHLGIDLFSVAGQPVFAPFDGIIHSFAYNAEPLDYGNILIISHLTNNGQPFYTLYGHLSNESLLGKEAGTGVKAGERIATTGVPEENGGWTPHLHFQLVNSLQEVNCDFPGVCRPRERETWKILSPDPNMVLCFPGSLHGAEPVDEKVTLSRRRELLGTSLSLGYRKHIKMARGWMQFMYDSNGQKYLDGYNNVPHVGHCHPEVVNAATGQMQKLNTNTRYLYDSITDYAELLLSTFPPVLDRCFFLNSGSEANELALRLAFTATGRRDTIVLEGAYHGNTTSLIDISPYKHEGPGGKGAPGWVHTVEVADCYRGRYKYDDQTAGEKYASIVSSVINRIGSEGRGVAAFIAETCPSVGGQIIFPPGYLEDVYRYIRESGGLCIADEVQTAYGRMGETFYAFEQQGVVPDIVVLGKPIGNGHPLAAVITTSSIAASFDNGMEFFSTFGGNSVSSAVGKKVLEITLRDNLLEHACKTGSY
ncbi:MAG: aminotransferase class III-fold pyridoxal phosphate-dependent enzyme, partial [Bacteroidia bacterium]